MKISQLFLDFIKFTLVVQLCVYESVNHVAKTCGRAGDHMRSEVYADRVFRIYRKGCTRRATPTEIGVQVS